jgi:ABC-2 type transport system ATP-binding protein
MTRPSHPVVQVRGLCKSYGGRHVVDHVDLDVGEGEIVGLLGANGAGKTTAVECIEGLRQADAGRIRVFGLDPATENARLRPLIGIQTQDSALPDRMHVEEAIGLFSGPSAPSPDGLLSAFGLDRHRRQPFAKLSGGQRQRLFLILALLKRPRLVVLDELTQGLDPAGRRDVWDAIRSMRDGGTTVLLVTHFMDEADALCDRVVVMRQGHVVDAGRPTDLIDRHARWATVCFTANGPSVDALQRLDGVYAVVRIGSALEVRGDRRMIAYVGAELVRHGSVPEDLSVRMPSLEDAIVSLLRQQPPPEMRGGVR